MNWLKRPHSLLVTAILLAQIAVLYGFSRRENTPSRPSLAGVPTEFDTWRMTQEGVVEKEVQAVLRADELLNRTYQGPGMALHPAAPNRATACLARSRAHTARCDPAAERV